MSIQTSITPPVAVACPEVVSHDWFDVLDAAGNALHNLQYPLREMSLPTYPAGGICGSHNLAVALANIVQAEDAIRELEKQLGQWCAMNETAHGASSNKPTDQ
jgi:hypothetical protein